jgi:hypothetical protein
MAGIVSGIVHEIAARETRAGQQKQPEGEDNKAKELALANGCG